MAPDTMAVRLHLRLIRVVAVLVDTVDELIVQVGSTRSTSRCPDCGFACRQVHDTRSQRFRDLPVSGRRVTLVWQRRRFVCANCGERHIEVHPAFEGHLTARLARQVVADARVMAIRSVARRHGVSWSVVMALVTQWSALLAAHRRKSHCRVLLIDETSMRRRHRYVTVLQNGETGEILAMDSASKRPGGSRVSRPPGPSLVPGSTRRGDRWFQGLQGCGAVSSRPRHPRP